MHAKALDEHWRGQQVGRAFLPITGPRANALCAWECGCAETAVALSGVVHLRVQVDECFS